MIDVIKVKLIDKAREIVFSLIIILLMFKFFGVIAGFVSLALATAALTLSFERAAVIFIFVGSTVVMYLVFQNPHDFIMG